MTKIQGKMAWDRRTFLKFCTMLAAEAAWPVKAEETVKADNVYLYNNGASLIEGELTDLAQQAELHYKKAGIGFKKVEVLEGNDFPELKELDMLMHIVDWEKVKDVYKGTPNQHTGGMFGIGWSGILMTETEKFERNEDEYNRFRTNFQHPYDLVTSANNTGFISVRKSYQPSLKRCQGKEESEVKMAELGKLLVHELGHGLGGTHIVQRHFDGYRLKLDTTYFMGITLLQEICSLEDYTFHEGNLSRMKAFIDEAKKSKFSKPELINLRGEYVGQRQVVN